jgi:hypothetical protein
MKLRPNYYWQQNDWRIQDLTNLEWLLVGLLFFGPHSIRWWIASMFGVVWLTRIVLWLKLEEPNK